MDVGSSGLRAIALTERGETVSYVARPRRRPAMSLLTLERDLDLEALWSELLEVLSEVNAGAIAAGASVRSLGLATLRHSLVLEDATGQVLLASGNDDLRASFQGAAIDEVAGEDLMRATGHRPAMIFWPGKLAWVDEIAPGLAAQIARMLSLDAWLTARLCGSATLSPASAAETGAWRLGERSWSDGHLPEWTRGRLPGVTSEFAAGTLKPELVELTGLPESCVVATGQPDTLAAELGTRRPELLASDCVTAGSSATVVRPLPSLPEDAAVWRTVRIGGGHLAESNAGDAATGYGWLRRFAPDGELTDHAGGSVSAAEQGVFAVTGLRVMDPAAPNLGVAGMLAPVPFAAETPDLDLLATAVLEDLGFALRGNRARLDGLLAPSGVVRLTGGYIGAPAAGSILASVLGCQVACFPRVPASAIGAAICGAVASGDLSLVQALEALSASPQMIEPDLARAAGFRDHYARWLELRRKLESFVQETL